MIGPDDSTERTTWDHAAAAIGRTPAEVAAWDRVLAGLVDLEVAKGSLCVELEDATRKMKNFVVAMQRAELAATEYATAEIAAHPDLNYLDVQMDGFYS